MNIIDINMYYNDNKVIVSFGENKLLRDTIIINSDIIGHIHEGLTRQSFIELFEVEGFNKLLDSPYELEDFEIYTICLNGQYCNDDIIKCDNIPRCETYRTSIAVIIKERNIWRDKNVF